MYSPFVSLLATETDVTKTSMNAFTSILDHYREGPYRDFAQEHRTGGTFGIKMFEVRQEPLETVDPAVSETIFVSSIKRTDPFETNFGDGWKRHVPQGRILDIQPAFTECGLRLPELDVRVATICHAELGKILDRHGLTVFDLSAVMEKFTNIPQGIKALDRMWEAANRADPAATLDLDGAFLTMLGELIAACGYGLPAAPQLDDTRLARAVDYAETHIAARLSVGELAAAAAMSPSAFSRAFKAATGETPWHYIRRRRLERAGEMLHRTDASLFEIAVKCGFADASHLARCWKAAHGTTPRKVSS